MHFDDQIISVEYKKKRLRIAKTFVAWLAEKGLIPVPPNLHSRRHRFGRGSRSVPTIPVGSSARWSGKHPVSSSFTCSS